MFNKDKSSEPDGGQGIPFMMVLSSAFVRIINSNYWEVIRHCIQSILPSVQWKTALHENHDHDIQSFEHKNVSGANINFYSLVFQSKKYYVIYIYTNFIDFVFVI